MANSKKRFQVTVKNGKIVRTTAKKSVPRIPSQELKVFKLLAVGFTTNEVAKLLGISPRTVGWYFEHTKKRLGTNKLAETVWYALYLGILNVPKKYHADKSERANYILKRQG